MLLENTHLNGICAYIPYLIFIYPNSKKYRLESPIVGSRLPSKPLRPTALKLHSSLTGPTSSSQLFGCGLKETNSCSAYPNVYIQSPESRLFDRIKARDSELPLLQLDTATPPAFLFRCSLINLPSRCPIFILMSIVCGTLLFLVFNYSVGS